jgi:hypothetical protein
MLRQRLERDWATSEPTDLLGVGTHDSRAAQGLGKRLQLSKRVTVRVCPAF